MKAETTPYWPRAMESAAIGTEGCASDQWCEMLSDLVGMRNLQNDWDGLGAVAPSPDLLESSIEWARHLQWRGQSAPSSVFAGPNGTILFNWQDENGYLDAELTEPHHIQWMQIIPGRAAQHGAFFTVPASQWGDAKRAVSGSSNLVPLSSSEHAGLGLTSLHTVVEQLTRWRTTGLASTV